ncbi:MAG: hypothetical protein M1542_00820 [Thermotogae bacterium]|nr:hypothetical protein [Thermotogota bacterium]MCL5031780.1 hypothetical protein [Thermotogota bacterium]
MKRKSFKFEVDKSSSDEIMKLLANYACQNFYLFFQRSIVYTAEMNLKM